MLTLKFTLLETEDSLKSYLKQSRPKMIAPFKMKLLALAFAIDAAKYRVRLVKENAWSLIATQEKVTFNIPLKL